MPTHHVKSWNDLAERLYANSWQSKLGRFRSKYAFRGMQNADAKLSTTLSRLGGPFARHEGHLLRNFRKYAHRDAVPGDSVWNWLSLGLGLIWSGNVLVLTLATVLWARLARQ